MAETGVKFIVKDKFTPDLGSEGKISLKIETDRKPENIDFKALIPLQIEYKKQHPDTMIQIKASATGNEFSTTFGSFRGQFISPVMDEKYRHEIDSIPHLINQEGSTKKTFVERCTWEEGASPQIQLIAGRKEGVIDLHFLAILSGIETRAGIKIDPDVGIEIVVEEIDCESGRGKPLGTFNVKLDKDSEHRFDYEETRIITAFKKDTHLITGDGSSIHPKQLITVDLLKSTLNPNTIEFFDNDINLGYIGLDTGENLLSVIRYIDRMDLRNKISSLNVFYGKEWDDSYRRQLAPTIESSGLKINWVEIGQEDIEDYRVDFMISTYVAVWAANDANIKTAEHEEYFENSYKWCKDKALLISIDPIDSKKIARSHRYAGTIDVTAYYKRVGFKEIEEILVGGENATCRDTIWKKGNWGYELTDPEPVADNSI